MNSVYVDLENERIYTVVDINSNIYHERTVYEPGSMSQGMNPNIAIVAMSFEFGTRLWVTLLGDPENIDYFSGLSIFNNHLYVALTSHTSTYSNNETQTDIIYTKLRSDNGLVVHSKILGSPSDDSALEIVAGQAGVFIMAVIGDQFLPHYDPTKYWQSNGGASKTNFAMLLIKDSDGTLIDIEGYDLSTMADPYPKSFSLTLGTGTREFIFYSPRANDDVNGLYVTKFTNSSLVFVDDTANVCTDTTNCDRCNANDRSMCMICQSGKFLYNSLCFAACPTSSYIATDTSNTALEVCAPCHFSWASCVGPKIDQCMTCCTGGTWGADYDREPNNGQCSCGAGKIESNGKCVTNCDTGLRGRYQDYCLTECPSDTYRYFDWDRTGTSQEYSNKDPSSITEWFDSVNHLLFKKDGYGIAVDGPKGLIAVPEEYTISFWIKPTGTFLSYGRDSTILNLFDVIKIYITTSDKIRYEVGDSGSHISPTYDSANDTLDLTQWNFVSATLKHIKTSPNNEVFIQLSLAHGRTGTLLKAGEAYVQLPTFSTFSNTIILGGSSISTPESFSGYLKEFRFFNKFHSFDQLAVDQLKIYQPYNYDDKNIIAHW